MCTGSISPWHRISVQTPGATAIAPTPTAPQDAVNRATARRSNFWSDSTPSRTEVVTATDEASTISPA